MDELLKKIEDLKGKSGPDLSMEEDLSLAVMNLISLEEHFFFTAEKTSKDEYFNKIKEVRNLRKKLLAKMIPQNEGETWCISKHLLAATMRLMEVGTKYQTKNDDKKAKEAFDDAYIVFNLFWAIRLKLLKLKDLTGVVHELPEENDSKPWKLEDITNKLMDCCRE